MINLNRVTADMASRVQNFVQGISPCRLDVDFVDGANALYRVECPVYGAIHIRFCRLPQHVTARVEWIGDGGKPQTKILTSF